MEYEGQEIYCICRKPDNGKWMIACDGCDDWFHGDCVKMREVDTELVEQYICPNCNAEGKGRTLWKRVCRLPGCRKPAKVGQNPPSKYCCKEHGVEFFREVMKAAKNQGEKAIQPGQLATILHDMEVSGNKTAQDFKALGERVPTPPLVNRIKQNPALDTDGRFAPELSAIVKQKERLAKAYDRKHRSEKRAEFLSLCIQRAKRAVSEETGKPVCGFDKRIILDDEDLLELAHAGYPEDSANMCHSGVNCGKHKGWAKKFADEIQYEDQLVQEELQAIKADEKRVHENMKWKAIGRDDAKLEGWTEVEG